MRFMEIASPEDQLALWRLISDNVWSAVMAQAKEQAQSKAQATAAAKVKKGRAPKAAPKPVQPLKPKLPTPKAAAHKSPIPKPARSVTPSRPPPLPSSQPVLRPTQSSSFSQADAYGLQQKTMGTAQASVPR